MTDQQTDIEKTLKRILARELPEWPKASFALTQSTHDHEIINDDELGTSLEIPFFTDKKHSKSVMYPRVTRADWEAERALLASEQAQQLGDSEEFDQVLWDKVAIKSMIAYMSQPNAIGDVPIEEFVGWGVGIADAFMAERAKRIAARKAKND